MLVSTKHTSNTDIEDQLEYSFIGAELEVSNTGNQVETGNKQGINLTRDMSSSNTRDSSPTVQSHHRTVVLGPDSLNHMAQSMEPRAGRSSPSSLYPPNFHNITGPPSDPGTCTFHQSGSSWQHEQPPRHTLQRPIEQSDRQYLRSNDDDELAYRRYNSDSYRNDHTMKQRPQDFR